ncbi:prepilin-type N-terminal cleavage/methylation domain-containing protein [Sulfuriferula nivalis]|uniref:MSHA biogenesis protein MshO n=1 Tax=Sulfuriferula nivalis TaxID=2675298 RepID=A0A809SI34_9PROT|nr:prepilin-type N-terminal cleavage/methylation domain-containing protein [Sulfuriferula nivalis]BBP01370.1 MSHA biogenesis protein MshO [Sulfuriferula nivalis]
MIMNNRRQHRGFTLIEMIVVITITGIIAAVVATFIRAPIQGYLDSANRAALTDVADTAVRRIGRDLHLALPNSVRITSAGGITYLEFLLTSGGGRYRIDTPGNPLDFTTADTSFDVLGPPVSMTAGAQNLLAIYNLGISGANAYNGDNTSAISAAGNTVTFAYKLFPFDSPSHRFQIIQYPVTYACDTTAGTLTRYWNYPININQPTSFTGGSSALLAKNVSLCSFSYDQQVITQRAGLVAISLQLTQNGESVNLYDEVHVSNAP